MKNILEIFILLDSSSYQLIPQIVVIPTDEEE
ncbi:MAG: hypothetical protein CM1200mP11_2400 [Nitrosopumilaceae archaeon]|nr:MAG: hypothetical protein CM1200mP11_2400 [Nitrosopumilaceae archaeon]